MRKPSGAVLRQALHRVIPEVVVLALLAVGDHRRAGGLELAHRVAHRAPRRAARASDRTGRASPRPRSAQRGAGCCRSVRWGSSHAAVGPPSIIRHRSTLHPRSGAATHVADRYGASAKDPAGRVAPEPFLHESRAMPTGKDVYRVGITGSYGGMNLGDEAILQSIIAPAAQGPAAGRNHRVLARRRGHQAPPPGRARACRCASSRAPRSRPRSSGSTC